MVGPMTEEFEEALSHVGRMTMDLHGRTLLAHAEQNLPHVKKTVRDLPPLPPEKRQSAIVLNAGPSLHQKGTVRRIVKAGYRGTVVCADGSYVACLREGLIPDFVLTLDPHPTRIVRWFGDHDMLANAKGDDFFKRQDLDVEFRKEAIETNRRAIELVDRHAPQTKAIVSSSAPPNVVARLVKAKADIYWWNPLVDDPRQPGSLTRALYDLNGLPAFNTGGNVGSAAWVFTISRLRIPEVAVAGMDLGYYIDTPFENTQSYNELIKYNGSAEGLERYFTEFTFPLDGKRYRTDPTYFWYRQNFLNLLAKAPGRTVNCTEGGTLFSERLPCLSLDEFLSQHAGARG